MPFPPMQSALKRPSAPSNMIARGNALPAAPAYGNTTNVTGAQTAQQSASSAIGNATRSALGVSGDDDATAQAKLNAPNVAYPGGDAPGIAAYYRNSALNSYQGGQKMTTALPGAPFTSIANAGMMLAGVPNMPYIPIGSVPDERMRGPKPPESNQGSSVLNPIYSQRALGGMLSGAGGGPTSIASAVGQQYGANAIQSPLAAQISAITMDARNANAPAVAQPETAQQTLSRIQSTNQQRLQAQEAARQQNTRGFASVLDPNRLRPEQIQQIAETSARQAGENDPTGLRGRMAGFGAGPGDTWYDRYEQAQLNQERADRAARAEARYNSPEKVQERAARSALKATPEYQQKIKDAKIRRDAAAQGYRDEHGGLSRRQVRRLEQIRRINQQQVRAGRISQEEADARMGYRADEFKSQAAAGQANKSALNATSLDRVRLPDGQLPAATREKAATTAKNLTDPNYKAPTPQFRKEAEIVQSLGLTHEMSAPEATAIIDATPIPQEPSARKQYVAAIRKYWGSMRDADTEWSKVGSPQAESLNRLAELPESEWDKWLTQDWPKTQVGLQGFQVPSGNLPGMGGAPFGR